MDEKPAEQKPKKKRPWFQFHLSTAIVGVVAIGALMWFDYYVIGLLGGTFRDNMFVRILDLTLIDLFCLYCIIVGAEKFARRRDE